MTSPQLRRSRLRRAATVLALSVGLLGLAPGAAQGAPAGSTAPSSDPSSVRSVWSWGWNGYGTLGQGTASELPSPTPARLLGLDDVVDVDGGGLNSFAVTSLGTVWGWGNNGYGQVGDGTTTNRHVPVQVSGLTHATAVASGTYHTLALKADGTVWAWGFNRDGQLGDGTTTSRSAPVQVSGLTEVTAIAAGAEHSLAVRSDGTVWAWGRNYEAQLGDGTTAARHVPIHVTGPTKATSVAAGDGHSLAATSDGTVWGWGRNIFGEVGDGTTTKRFLAVQVPDLTGVRTVTAGLHHSLALKTDGTVWSWGWNNVGQLGDGSVVDRPSPVQVQGLGGVRVLSAGAQTGLAVRTDGTARAWGTNHYGQLGDGTTTTRKTPVPVQGLSGLSDADAGHGHALALRDVQPLSVSRAGTGSGTVTSAPAGVQCGASCTWEFLTDSSVTLTATPGATSTFTGWTGAGCTGTAPCVVTMDQARQVTATFTTITHDLGVTTAGTGGGTVTSDPTGIDCGTTCTAPYDTGTLVTLTAAPDPTSTFTGWTGAGCTGTAACVVTMDQARQVTATFASSCDAVVSVGPLAYTPARADVAAGGCVTWVFDDGTHTVTESRGLGEAAGPLFDSGTRSSGTYAAEFDAAGRYPYRSDAPGAPAGMKGTVSVPLVLSDTRATPRQRVTITWAAAEQPGYRFDTQYRFKAPGGRFKAWKDWRTDRTSTSGTFRAKAVSGRGGYQFRSRMENAATGRTSLWSVPEALTVSKAR